MKDFDAIPREEYLERVKSIQKLMAEEKVDVIIAFGNACEPQYLRYLADFRVAFETGGVGIPQNGDATLIVGPETLGRAKMSNPLPNVMRMGCFRELASPAYEDPAADTFETLFEDYKKNNTIKKVGIVGWRMIPMDIYKEIEHYLNICCDGAELVNADYIVDKARESKSEAEISLLNKAGHIAKATLEYTISRIKVGMTGDEIRGIALGKMIELGAEGEAFPMWVISQDETEFAISTSSKQHIKEGDLVQIQIGAMYNGYCSACGRPVVIGKAEPAVYDLIKACANAKKAVEKALETAKTSTEVADAHRKQVIADGHEKHLVYGPCHSIGLVECENPWIESGNDYELKPGMTFCEDIFLSDSELHRGVRYEDMIMITENGFERITDMCNEIIIIPV